MAGARPGKHHRLQPDQVPPPAGAQPVRAGEEAQHPAPVEAAEQQSFGLGEGAGHPTDDHLLGVPGLDLLPAEGAGPVAAVRLLHHQALDPGDRPVRPPAAGGLLVGGLGAQRQLRRGAG
jgi:hypothetical protein